ncbi:MAG: hypothetical protein JNL25_17375 [Rhodospirillaceae bacterium]|nr:hypothetical protein [Rhodospirillaceae bacterium]
MSLPENTSPERAVAGPESLATTASGLRKVAAALLCGAILAGGLLLVALAGLLVRLLTEPFYPFLPFFAPIAIGIVWLAGHLLSRVVIGFFPAHPARQAWIRAGWVIAVVVLGLWAWGTYDLLTGPMHWQ